MSNTECVALLTGTTSGIGSAIAEVLLQEGWNVLGLSRRPASFENPRYCHVQIDLGDLEHLREIADHKLAPMMTNRHWQRIGLVNNAALSSDLRSVEETDPRILLQHFAVNTVAPIFLMGFLVRLTPPSVPLRMVNVSTGAAHLPIPGFVDYGVSKTALRFAGMTLAEELSADQRPGGALSNVAILSYEPGVVDTPMQDTLRSRVGPWNQPFVDFHARGMLQPPDAPAQEIVSFLTGDSTKPFEERRFTAP